MNNLASKPEPLITEIGAERLLAAVFGKSREGTSLAPIEGLDAEALHELRLRLEDTIYDLTQKSCKNPSRERRILYLRFGLYDEKPMTLREIGAIVKLTPERIRQIEGRLLRRLRHPSHSRFILTGRRVATGLSPSWDLLPWVAVGQVYADVIDIWRGSSPGGWDARWSGGFIPSILATLNDAFFGSDEGPIDRRFLEVHLLKALQKLQPFDFAVVCYRYGFIDGRRWLQKEVGEKCGIGQHKVGKIQSRCANELAEAIKASMIEELEKRGLRPASWNTLPVRSCYWH